jgi:flavodoxin
MRSLVTYYTRTGNTEKLARAIYEVIETDKGIMPMEELRSPGDYDVIFCGFPVQSHSVPVPVQTFIKSLPAGKKLAFFITHGSLRGGQLATTAIEHAVSLAPHSKVLGTFGCRGKVEPKIIEQLMKEPEHKKWAKEALSASSHPDQADLDDGKDFARKMMAKALSV